jgi:hypothetical protein
MARIGIFGVSSQSGAAYLADLVTEGAVVYGYARPSGHGGQVVDAIRAAGGIRVERPENDLDERSHFVPLLSSEVGHDLRRLAQDSDLIVFAHPSLYHEESVRQLAPYLRRRPVPIVLSPSRTLAAPYLWRILGENYPIVSFQTCPYSCKVFRPGSVFIKRRKRAWVASAEGRVGKDALSLLRSLYPQIVFSRTPAATSLGNIGAVFHPTAYVLNLPAIRQAAAEGRQFSFYQEGIANNPEVGAIVEEVDQIRLRIARSLGLATFGLRQDPCEEQWRQVMAGIDRLEAAPPDDLAERRRRRADLLAPIGDAVISAQHWLAYTYGVERIPGESLASAIGRTPTFQKASFPQARYADEDVPTGLVPLEALARRLGVGCGPISRVIDAYKKESGVDARKTGRNLTQFGLGYLRRYLRGEQAAGHSRRRERRWLEECAS